MADNLPVFTVSGAEPMHRRRRARPAGVVAGGVLGFVVGVVLGFAFAASVHAGAHSLVAMVPLLLGLVMARVHGSLTTQRYRRERPVHPYRDSPQPEPRKRVADDREEYVLCGLLVTIGAIPVVLALVSGTRFGVQATLGLLMALWGIAGLGTRWRGRPPS